MSGTATFPVFTKETVLFDESGRPHSKLSAKEAKGRGDAKQVFCDGAMVHVVPRSAPVQASVPASPANGAK